MRRRAPVVLLMLVLAALGGGLAGLFQLRLAQGDVFPAYSSLRSDPLGTRALHDSLAELPGLRVERQFRPLGEIRPSPAGTLILAGLPARRWTHLRREDFDALDALVRGGGRLVIALRAEEAGELRTRREQEREAEEKARKQRAENDEPEPPKPDYIDLKRRWGAEVKSRAMMDGNVSAEGKSETLGAGLPGTVAWRSELYFDLVPDAGWKVIWLRAAVPVLVERQLGAGSIVLAADSYWLSNEALQRDRVTTLLAWMVGPHRRVTFDEAHLGVVVQPGVAALARRYGLAGAAGTLLLLAVLFIWRRMALFVPPAETVDDVALTYHPAAGLEALLRRAVAPAELAATCVNEWRTTARERDRARVETALAAVPPDATPATRYNAALQALRKK